MNNLFDYPIITKSAVLRKALAFAHQPIRFAEKKLNYKQTYDQQPPILVNSLPKSGTHLMLQITRSLPNARYYGNFIATYPSLTLRERSAETIAHKISYLLPNETLGAHLHFSPTIKNALQSVNALSLFIYRDPRAVLVSEIFYLSKMNKFHRMHRHFAKLTSLDDKIQLALDGHSELYPNAEERFLPYAGWLNDPNTISIRYEEMVGHQKLDNIRKIVDHWYAISNSNETTNPKIEKTLLHAMDPQRSHTFREGGADLWRKRLTLAQTDLITRRLEPVLERFGYIR